MVIEFTSAKIIQTCNNQTPLQFTIIGLGRATASSDTSNETGESLKKDKTLFPPEFSALEKSNNNNNKISAEIDSWEEVSGKVDNNPDEPVITNMIGVEALEEPSKQVTIVDKADNSASKPIHDNQVLLNGKNDSSTTLCEDLSTTNNMTEEYSKSINSNNSDINVVEVIFEEPTLENVVSSITENANIKTNNEEIETEKKNLESQQDTVKSVSSKDNERKKDAVNFQEVIPGKNLDTDKN